jgi:hypothetical protein
MSTEQMLMMNELEQPKSTQSFLELPCGYIDDEDVLHREIEISELTGEEEDMLASRTVPANKKMSILIGRCVTRIGDITDKGKIAMIANKLTVGDRTFLIFALRRLTLGELYPFRVGCPQCNKEGMYQVQMSDLEVREMPTPEKRVYEHELPSGKAVRFRIMIGSDEERVSKMRSMDDKVSAAMLMRLELLDGKPPTLQEIKRLTMRDRDDLRCAFEDVDGGVDTTLEMTCSNCGAEFESDVDAGQAGFFFPSMTRRKSKTRSFT